MSNWFHSKPKTNKFDSGPSRTKNLDLTRHQTVIDSSDNVTDFFTGIVVGQVLGDIVTGVVNGIADGIADTDMFNGDGGSGGGGGDSG